MLFEANSPFKRDITNAFDAINSYLIKKKAKIQKNTIRIYTGYNTSTGSMGHSAIVQTGDMLFISCYVLCEYLLCLITSYH